MAGREGVTVPVPADPTVAQHLVDAWVWLEEEVLGAVVPLPVVSRGELSHLDPDCAPGASGVVVSLRDGAPLRWCPACRRVTGSISPDVPVSATWVSWAVEVVHLLRHRDELPVRVFESELWKLVSCAPSRDAHTLALMSHAVSVVPVVHHPQKWTLVSGMVPWVPGGTVCPADVTRASSGVRRVSQRDVHMSEVLRGTASGFVMSPLGPPARPGGHEFIAALPRESVSSLARLVSQPLRVFGEVTDLATVRLACEAVALRPALDRREVLAGLPHL